MGLKWIDVQDIAIELAERYEQINPLTVNFVDLRDMVMSLDDFEDDPAHCGEKVLEAIQAAWIEEAD